MGGGPIGTDTIRTMCLLTFPRETKSYPVPIDAVYLEHVGVQALKSVGRRIVGRKRRFGVLHQRPAGEYVSVCRNEDLRKEIRRSIENSEPWIYIHLIFVQRVPPTGPIRVCAGTDRTFSPEPIEEEEEENNNAVVSNTIPEKQYGKAASTLQPIVEEKEGTSADEYVHVPATTTVTATATDGSSDHRDQNAQPLALPRRQEQEQPTFYISDSWHLQAEEMSMSMSMSFTADAPPADSFVFVQRGR